MTEPGSDRTARTASASVVSRTATSRTATPVKHMTIGILLPVPEPYGGELRARRIGYGDPQGKLTPTHVTLLPPTELAAAAFPEVDRHLSRVAARGRPFRMRLYGTGTFRPVTQVVYVRVGEGRQECVDLEAGIRDGVLDRELQFPFHPHVTVAYQLEQERLDAAYLDLAGYDASFEVSGFTVYRQDGPGTPWQPVRTYPLGHSLRTAAA
jgi:2'-5' RNA ligase